MEFMYMIMAASLFVIIFISVFSNLYSDTLKEKKTNLFYDFASSIQKELIMASESKLGYERNFTLPDKVEGFDYDIFIIDKTLFLNYTDNSIYLPVPPVKGILKKGQNTLMNNGTIIIK